MMFMIRGLSLYLHGEKCMVVDFQSVSLIINYSTLSLQLQLYDLQIFRISQYDHLPSTYEQYSTGVTKYCELCEPAEQAPLSLEKDNCIFAHCMFHPSLKLLIEQQLRAAGSPYILLCYKLCMAHSLIKNNNCLGNCMELFLLIDPW